MERGKIMNLENSKLSLFTVIGFLPTVIGGIIWLTNIHAKADAAQAKLDKLEKTIVDIAEIRKDIEYIRLKLDNQGRK